MEHNPLSMQLFTIMLRFPKAKRKSAAKRHCFFPGDMAVFHLVCHINEEEGSDKVKMSDISRLMGISKPAATQAVDRLVDRGMVRRVNDENDRRTVYIQITEKGETGFKIELDRNLGIIDKVIDNMGEKDAREFIRLFTKFKQSMDDAVKESEENDID